MKPFLLYYYYGGMIYTGIKKFERALHFFEVVWLVWYSTCCSEQAYDYACLGCNNTCTSY